MKIGIIGAGKWGSALYFAFSQNNEVIITSRNKKQIENFVSVKEVLECEYLVFALSAQHAKEWMQENFVFKGQKMLVVSKGIDAKSGEFMSDIFEGFLPQKNLAYLTGPSFAFEVQKGLPCAIVVNSYSKKLAKMYASFFPSFMKAYISKDVIGAEVSGAYKNVIAIASGICDGLELGNNARASLISRGLVEMHRFGRHFGAKKKTFYGLSGAGDLFLTASSKLSRNYRVGLGLADGKSMEQILEELGEVAEGVVSAKAIYDLAQKHNVYTPIATEIHHIINGKNVKESLKDLLQS
jgi:glycerol-3-phosphate dehydrogenase (NAD(P)+)